MPSTWAHFQQFGRLCKRKHDKDADHPILLQIQEQQQLDAERTGVTSSSE